MKQINLVTHKEVLGKYLKNEQFRKGYEQELEKLHIAHALVNLREKRGLTQAALARRMHVTQPFIAKLESGQIRNFNLETLVKVAVALDSELEVRFRPHVARAA